MTTRRCTESGSRRGAGVFIAIAPYGQPWDGRAAPGDHDDQQSRVRNGARFQFNTPARRKPSRVDVVGALGRPVVDDPDAVNGCISTGSWRNRARFWQHGDGQTPPAEPFCQHSRPAEYKALPGGQRHTH